MMKKELIIIALGGNALLKSGQIGSIDEQNLNVRETLHSLYPLIKQGHHLIITHGNGPQVGFVLLKNDAGEQVYNIPQIPLDVAVADTQSEIGYLIQSELFSLLRQNGIDREIISTNTMVRIDPDDPAFNNPTKRIGKTYYDKAEVEKLITTKKWQFKEEVKNGKKGWRRVVPSPKPVDIISKNTIKALAENGSIVIAVGGGGIPVAVIGDTMYGQEAVIDKDLATALLATQIKADKFIILTDVPYVYLDYGTKNQRPVEKITVEEAEKMMKNGVFGEGNMSPKIQAAINFIKNGGQEVLITDLNGIKHQVGTKIVSSSGKIKKL
jgi:carbamate kinase